MIKLTQCTQTFGDCSAGYEVFMDKQYTVRGFINEVLKREEWGEIRVVYKNQTRFERGNPFCEYKNDSIVAEMPVDCLDKIVIKAAAHGGWSNMDYALSV
jgi:hypothetical protein